ncbi:transcriptional regulator, partial [Lysobacter sp. 2RAB21]
LLSEAAQGYAAQTQMLRELIDSEPDADEWRRKLATSLLRSSVLALDRGRLDEAQTEIDEAVTLLDALVEQQPDNKVWRRNLGHAYSHAGLVASLSGARERAVERLRAAQRTLAPIMRETDPPPEWRLLDANVRLH